jgi:uncharacterized protein YerC
MTAKGQQRPRTSDWQLQSLESTSADGLALPRNLQAENLQALTTSHAIRQALKQFGSYSSRLDVHLNDLIKDSSEHITSSQDLICSLGQQVHLIEDEAKVLERRLKETGVTAERISESVRRLDIESERVEKARAWTEAVETLKASLQSLSSCIALQDYSAATQHCIRAMSIDEQILHSNFAATMVPSSDHPEPPPVQLESLRRTLLDVFTGKFEAAIDAKDTVEATTYFKMFPLVGWRNEGLKVYREFARAMVRERGRAITDGLVASQEAAALQHAALLTKLFEHLALLIDQHQPLVDRFYGAGDFAKGVMPGLQEECDRLGVRVCDAWYEERNVQRKIIEAKSYNFTYVASIGKAPKARPNPAGQRGPGGFNIPSIPGRPSTPSNAGSSADGQDGEMEVDTREVDRIIGEVAAMATRWGTYRLFLANRLAAPSESEAVENGHAGPNEVKDYRRSSVDEKRLSISGPSSQNVNGSKDDGEGIVQTSQLGSRINSLLESVYVPLESYFLRCSIEKAHRMDTTDVSSRPLMSSLLDDIFYLVRMVVARSISTASMDVLSSMCRNVRYIVDEDFVQALVRKMDGVWKASSPSMAVEGPRKDAASREMRSTFVVYLNVLATSAEYLSRIISSLSNEESLSQRFVPTEIPLAVSTVQGLSILMPRIRNAVRTHLDLLYTALIKPKLKQVLNDSLRDVSYLINEEEFSRMEQETGASSTFIRRFTKGWNNVLGSSNYRQIFLPENWESFLRLAIDTVVQDWEDWSMNVKYSELGALCFDKDVRSLTSFLSSQSTLGGLRDKFARLTHMSYLVNLDEEVDEEIMQGGQVSVKGGEVAWRFTSEQVSHIRARRVQW